MADKMKTWQKRYEPYDPDIAITLCMLNTYDISHYHHKPEVTTKQKITAVPLDARQVDTLKRLNFEVI